jgi:uncharacterized protein (DUF983 family)
VLQEIEIAVLVLLVLAFIAVSFYFMEVSSGKPLWERIVYWAVSALFIIVASCLLLVTIMYVAYIILEKMDRWKPGF